MTGLIRGMKQSKKLLALLLVLLPATAFAVPGDYDGDGTSDFSVALVAKSSSANVGNTAWLTRPTNNSTPLFWTWNVPADAFVAGRFFLDNPRYYPGAVWVRSSSLPLEWYIKTPENQEVFLQFGLPGDTIPALGDWDGDGRDDIAVVRDINGVLNWFVAQTSNGVLMQYVFGVTGDKPFVTDADGDGEAEMVVLRAGFWWFIMNPGEGSFSQVQWGLDGDIPLPPVDLDGDHLPDHVISRLTGYLQKAYVRYGNGQTETLDLGFDSSIPQIGHFSGNLPVFAWTQRDTGWNAIRSVTRTPSFFQLGIPTNVIIRADGTVVSPTDDGRYPATTTDNGGTDNGGTDNGGSGGSASCKTVYSSGWLLKPNSQDTNDAREGKPLILFTRNYPSSSCLNIIAKDGTVVGHYGKYSSNRFYSGYGCGEGHSGSTLATKASNAAGSRSIYVQDPNTGACYGPGDPSQRTDKR
ncbi:MAG: hypothetical protein PHC51_05685 [bacterium]|nr:hypothetical protein [bacterium]